MEPKFQAKGARHARDQEALRDLGWTVLVVWECDLHDAPAIEGVIDAVRRSPPRP
ncbi:MAG: hypothetical protein JWM33_1983 [Caulobacteraceae bacterium]|nr:hypothetical protein [Caulobacteraceae bacterium]